MYKMYKVLKTTRTPLGYIAKHLEGSVGCAVR